jgi:hypothetical protein
MFSEKKSIPGGRDDKPEVRALRWERRNILDLPIMQGAMATVEMAV